MVAYGGNVGLDEKGAAFYMNDGSDGKGSGKNGRGVASGSGARGAALSSALAALGAAGDELRKAQQQSAASVGGHVQPASRWTATGHPALAAVNEEEDGELQFWCPTCGKGFANAYKLRQHQRDNNYCSAAKASDDEENGGMMRDDELDHEDQYAGMTRGAIRRSKGHKTKRGGKRVQEQKAKKRAILTPSPESISDSPGDTVTMVARVMGANK